MRVFKDFDIDAEIEDLFRATYENKASVITSYSNRAMQQRLGPIIARINRKLDGQRIVPGRMKRTYRLIRVN